MSKIGDRARAFVRGIGSAFDVAGRARRGEERRRRWVEQAGNPRSDPRFNAGNAAEVAVLAERRRVHDLTTQTALLACDEIKVMASDDPDPVISDDPVGLRRAADYAEHHAGIAQTLGHDSIARVLGNRAWRLREQARLADLDRPVDLDRPDGSPVIDADVDGGP